MFRLLRWRWISDGERTYYCDSSRGLSLSPNRVLPEFCRNPWVLVLRFQEIINRQGYWVNIFKTVLLTPISDASRFHNLFSRRKRVPQPQDVHFSEADLPVRKVVCLKYSEQILVTPCATRDLERKGVSLLNV